MIKNQKGFTLIELILYIALISIFISGAVLFGWDIIYSQVRSSTQQELQQNMRLAAKRISYEIRNASEIGTISATDICLYSNISERNPTRFYLSGGQIRVAWGGGNPSCNNMTNDQPLTSSDLTATSLSFTDLSSAPESQHAAFSFALEASSTLQEWQESQTYASSVEIRTP